MGKKKSTLKNIIVTLGCATFAGVYILGGKYVVNTFLNGGNTTKPTWLDRVEIRVDENAIDSARADASVSGNVAAEAEGVESVQEGENDLAGQEADSSGNHGGNQDRPNSSNTLQKPRFEEDETQTETETETEAETKQEQTESKTKDFAEISQVQVIQQEDQELVVIADVTAVVNAAMPCVVAITNEYTAYDYWYDEEYDEQVNGSGIIVAQSDEELLIVTNYHVIENNNNLYVQFIDDEETVAYVKGFSQENDLAIISVFLEDVPNDTLEAIAIAALGNSDSLQVGEPAIAIGNSLGYGQSVTTGVISALNRNVFADDPDTIPGYLIQTDAAINPGNSGGALLNVKGEVIGINSSKIADYVIEGMGYAIPISTARPIIEDLMQKETKKKVPEEERAFLGIAGTDVIEEATARYEMPEGVYVTDVIEDTAADEAGILKGDVIIYIDGTKVTRMEQLQEVLEYYAVGTEIEVVLMRQSNGEYKQRTVNVMLKYKE